MFKILILLFGINFVSVNLQELAPGNACTVKRTQSPGICKPISDCPKAIINIQKRIQNTRCGFVSLTEIVCCPEESKPTPPPEPIANRTCSRKCVEYSAAVYEYVYSISLSLGSERTKVKTDKCGHKVIPLVVGGENAKPREFPHMALIGYDGEDGKSWSCGGSLISEQYVLTAAHCTKTFYGDPKYVRLGDLDYSRDDEDARPEEFNVIEVIQGPNYSPKTKYNDIALLKLDRKAVLSPYIRPICLPTTYDGPEKQAIATGWGHTEWAGKSSDHLQKVVLDKFTQAECNSTYVYSINRKLEQGITYETQLCAGSKSESKDTCQGDSGGPLQVFHPTEYCMYTIVGVTSFGIACGSVGVPGVYTRVFSYLDWIEENVWGNQ